MQGNRPNESGPPPEDDPPRDPGVSQYHSYTPDEIEGHRAHSIYVGVHFPGSHRRKSRHHRHHHHRHRHSDKNNDDDNRPGNVFSFI